MGGYQNGQYRCGLWLFKNRLYGAIDLYKRYTSNLLMNSVKVAAGSNFAESIDQNIGEMSSKGIEFAIGGVPVRTKNFSWNLNFNFAWNASKIEKLTVYDGPPEKTWVKTGIRALIVMPNIIK
ncbi:TonB-dependent receptor [Niabella sp. W65]|nr:TonB-dependent receptor [Niabella sp. W65]MCH7366950.1 TonB-dependent receptor [Niabella sp. W65]ULT42642.1 TonB-dependent receptor [Niabella sp. I65]